MKKALSVVLTLVLIVGMVFTMPIGASAITIEEIEEAANYEKIVFDFENPDFMKVGFQFLSDDKVEWKVDATNTLSYYYSGWGLSSIANNPVTGQTGAEGSIVNSSEKVLRANKLSSYNTWGTGGGIVLNTITENGVKPYILESNTTYTVEFDYLVKSTHLYGEIAKPDGSGNITISTTSADTLSFGYGYKENTDEQLGAVDKPKKTVATVASYKPSVNVDGYFTAHDNSQKPIGSWYHASYTFTTDNFESIYSTNYAPFLIMYTSVFTGADIMVDNITVGKTKTISAFFDFEDKEYMHVTTQSGTSKKCEWQVDPTYKIEYHIAGWGFGSITDNPVTEPTGVAGSVVNASPKVMQARKTSYNTWSTSGGLVVNRKTEKGTEPLILEDNTTYTVEFDYIVNSTHIYGDWIDPNDGTKSGTIKETATSLMSFGYGYRTTNTVGTGASPVNTPKTTVDTIAKYTPSSNADGTYTDPDTNTTKQVGSWYHESHTFTTGTFDSIYTEFTTTSNLPFLVFYATLYTGDWFMVDNIRVTKHVNVNFHGNGGTVSASSDSGEAGTAITLPTAARLGYEFTGWYEDSSCTIPFTDTIFTMENAGSTIYAGWKMGIEGFENYAPVGMNTSRFSVATDKAYSGSKSLKYSWTKKTIDWNSERTSKNSYFPITSLDNNGAATSTYKLTFKYFLSSVDMTIQPALVKNASNSTSITTLGTSATLYSSGAGRWQTMSVVFTVTNSNLSTYPNLALYAYAATNTTTTAYFDDFKVTPVESGTGSLTVYGGKGNAAGASSRTVGLAVGDKIDSAFVYYSGYAVEGWYTDSALTNKVPADVYNTSITAVYPKFSDKVDLTADGTATRTGGFKKAGYEDVLYYDGTSGTASLAGVTSGKTYMVEFLYKNKGGTDVTATIGSSSVTLGRAKADKWYKGFIPVTATATSALMLNAEGNSSLEIKDVYIKDLTDLVYVIFDSTEFGGELTAIYGAAGETMNAPANPIVEGKSFDGWYNGATKVDTDVFPASSVSLTAKMVDGGEIKAGDCDGDGNVNTTDLAKMKLYLAKVDTKVAAGADINNDGKVNAIDLVRLYNQLMK